MQKNYIQVIYNEVRKESNYETIRPMNESKEYERKINMTTHSLGFNYVMGLIMSFKFAKFIENKEEGSEVHNYY